MSVAVYLLVADTEEGTVEASSRSQRPGGEE